MVNQCSCLAISCGCDQIPDEAFDVLISLVMVETVHEDGSADGFYIVLSELAFVASMRKDVCPPSPTAKQTLSMQMVPFRVRLGALLSQAKSSVRESWVTTRCILYQVTGKPSKA